MSPEPPRLFGTDGIRGVVGQFPLDAETVELIGRSLAVNLQYGLGHPLKMVIGRDTRESGPDIEQALAAGAIAAGARLDSAGIMTTPGIAFITRARKFDAGIVISASHNPYNDNGIKVFSPSGRKLADAIERAIESDLAPESDFRAAAPAHERLSRGLVADRHSEYRLEYLSYLLDEVSNDLSLDGWRVGLDCANGAAAAFAPDLFLRLGAAIEVIGVEPDGRNINAGCGSLHLDPLREMVSKRRLDLGIAFDGDADRALFVDSTGRVVDGDAMLLVLAEYLQSRGRLGGNVVVATVMSNIGLELALKERGIELVRAQVGDRYVLEELLARGAGLGGEQSGHIIFPNISLAGDGMITAIELLRAVLASGRSLDELANQMTRYPQVLVNVRVKAKPPLEGLPSVREEIRKTEEKLGACGRLLVRYSGTENLARVMIEGEDQSMIGELANNLAAVIGRELRE